MRAVRESLEHARRVEIPHRRAGHDVQPKGAKDGKVHCCIDLLHEAVLLYPGADVVPQGERADKALHEELAGEGEDDGVEGDKGEIQGPFAIVCRDIGFEAGVDGDERVGGVKRV